MPPYGLTSGLHNYSVDSPGLPYTILPVFYMSLFMSADQLALRKGQSTTYHVRLDGLNGLPGSAWNAPFYPTDLVSPAESNANQPPSGASRKGYITLSVTNGSPQNISMHDEFRVLDASSAAQGNYHLDGPVTAINDGAFTINGVARAYLDPEVGLGPGPNAPPPTSGGLGSGWMPPISWDSSLAAYGHSSLGNSFSISNCSETGAAPPASGQPSPAPTGGSAPPCMGTAAQDAYDRAIGNQPSIPVGNPPQTTDDREAARKRWSDAWSKKIEVDAKYETALEKERDAWKKAMEKVPQDVLDDYNKVMHRLMDAELDEFNMLNKYKKNPTEQNAQNHTFAVIEVARDKQDVANFKEALVKFHFTDEDRAAWQKAHDAREQAQKDADASPS